MATVIRTYRPHTTHVPWVLKWEEFIERFIPRRCMVISVTLILAGLSIPVLMVIHLLPATFLLGFAGFALAATGGILVLIFSGEI